MGADISIHELHTIPERLRYFSETTPDKELFIFYGEKGRSSLTAQQLYRLGGKFACRLHRAGVCHRDVVCNTLPNSPERVVTDVGIILAGCAVVNGAVRTAKNGADFFQSCRQTGTKACIVSNETESLPWHLLKEHITWSDSAKGVGQIQCDSAPSMTMVFTATRDLDLGVPLLENLKSSDEELFQEKNLHPDDTLMVMRTSGSTGFSKHCPRTHAQCISMVADMKADLKKYNLGQNETFFTFSGLGHVGGFPWTTYVYGASRALLDGYHLITVPTNEKRVPYSLRQWDVVTSEKCGLAVLLPVDVHNIVNARSSGHTHDDFSLKVLGYGGAPVKKSQIDRLLELAETVSISYASTEAGYVSSIWLKKDSEVVDYCCGMPNTGVSVKILDEKGEEVARGQHGYIFAKGCGVFSGYLCSEDQNGPCHVAFFTRDGYFETKDCGYMDDSGQLYVTGRSTELAIARNTGNVFPSYIESLILKHPQVLDVCVVPVQDHLVQNKLCAAIMQRDGNDVTEINLRKFLSSNVQDVGSSVIPDFILVLKEFPETDTGKPDRQFLTKMAEERFGSHRTS